MSVQIQFFENLLSKGSVLNNENRVSFIYLALKSNFLNIRRFRLFELKL